MKKLFRWCFRRLDVMEQIAIKKALRMYINTPQAEEGADELLKQYAGDLLRYLNEGEMVKF